MAEILRIKLLDAAEEIGQAYQRGREGLREAGRGLLEQQKTLPDGTFEAWLAENMENGKLRFKHRSTAYRLMRLANVAPGATCDDVWGHAGRPSGGGGSIEWYTPAEYVEKARAVLGEIDLDPASCEEAQKTVKAARFYSLADNGLEQPWSGRIWLNPPYAQPAIEHFAAKMVGSLESIEAAVMLTNSATDADWFQSLAHECNAICFTDGRIRFVGADGMPMQGQAFFYFGKNLKGFVRVFSEIGIVMRRV